MGGTVTDRWLNISAPLSGWPSSLDIQWSNDHTGDAMSDDRADLILNMLRAIRGKLDEHDRKFDEVIEGLGRVERELANLHVDFAGMHVRIDNVNQRLDRVERRLELVDESASSI